MKKKFLSLCGALALLAGAAACGSNETAGANPNVINVGSFPGTIYTYPLSVAEKKSFFTDQDLNVKLIEGKSGPEILSAMIGGSTQVIFGQPGAIVPAGAEGQELRILGPYSRGRVVMVATEESGITSLDDLPGKRFAVPQRGDSNEQRTLSVLAEYGIDGKEVTFIGTGTPATTAAAIANGQADASVLGLTTYESLLAKGSKLRIIADSAEGTMGERGRNDVTGMFATTKQFWSENPDTIGKFCRAMKSSIEWIVDEENADEATKILVDWTGLPEDAARAVWESERDTWSMDLSKELWDANVAYVDPTIDPNYGAIVTNGCP
ncbi:ABC transporter substrate-binding protein [Rhodococcus aetherivorans]|uniref:ABC transporter substrate-binding protein n=1 Tax=Rhodococcus aetherivorans TaxID=191292 RepID=UPI001E3BDEFA|nr:ABC transporter substrate-binding protein [Rhodococcus aetherivorans]UGQ40966.1 ABC transporter substrate-binding protein [Rhodococcus aetherivorans]